MFQALVRSARRLLGEFRRSFTRPVRATLGATTSAPASTPYVPLKRVLLTDGVGHTLFRGYAGHRRSKGRGNDETGWVLLGLREASEAVVLAALPAGTRADAGVAHIRFNSECQAVASRIVRQSDKRLTILGVVHTHPGSLRRPSDGDYRGDAEWVAHLRGREGVFAIGTADGPGGPPAPYAHQPRPHVQCWGDLRFSWYALGQGEKDYRPLPVEVTYGPDLARPLHDVWATLEAHAGRIERLYRQLAGIRFEVADGDGDPALAVVVPLPERGSTVRVVLRADGVRYFLERPGELLEWGQRDEWVDRGVFLLLAELAPRD